MSRTRSTRRNVTALIAAVSVACGAVVVPSAVGAPAEPAAPAASTGYSTGEGTHAQSIFFFDFAKLASGDAKDPATGFAGTLIKDGDSYTYTSKDGLPEGLEITVTVRGITKDAELTDYAEYDPAARNIDPEKLLEEGGLIARNTDYNHFFKPGTKEGGKYESNVLYPEAEGAKWEISQYIPESAFPPETDRASAVTGNLPVSFTLEAKAKLNGNEIKLDLFAADGEATAAQAAIGESLRLETNGGDWEVIQNLFPKASYPAPTQDNPDDMNTSDHRWAVITEPTGYAAKGADAAAQPDAGINGKVYNWIDTQFTSPGKGDGTHAQPILVSRAASEIKVSLNDRPWTNAGSRQGVVAGAFLPVDHGDAPTASAAHVLTGWATTGAPESDDRGVKYTSTYYLGQTSPQPDNGETNDQATADTDEDASVSKALARALRLQSGDTSADRKTLEVTIPAGGADAEGKTVSAWIDLNGNGEFDEGERATGTVKGGFAELTWQTPDGFNAPVAATAARKALTRVRIAEKPLTATETAFGGEVEDHLVEWTPAVIVTPTVTTPTTVTATATETTITPTTITATETLAASSKGNLERCWANAKTSPFLYLIPIGLLGAVAGELAKPYLGPINEQLNQVNAQIAKSFGSSQGNALNAQLQATLNDPNVQRFGSIAAGVLALAAVGGLLYDWCSSEPGEAATGSSRGNSLSTTPSTTPTTTTTPVTTTP